MSPADVDAVRTAVARVEALAHAAEEAFDNTLWDGEVDRGQLERVAHLIGAVTEAAERALAVADRLTGSGPDPEAIRAVVWDDPARGGDGGTR